MDAKRAHETAALPTVGSVWRNIPTENEATVIRVADVPVSAWDTAALADGATRPGIYMSSNPSHPWRADDFYDLWMKADQAMMR